MRRLFFILLSLLVLSCRPAVKTSTDTLIIGIETAPSSLDPRRTTDAYSSKISQLLHNGLFRLNERLEVVPDLVDRYEFVPPKRYIFHLKQGVRFQDGSICDVEDVKYTFESIQDSSLGSPFKGTFEKIESLTVLDPLTLQIDLKEVFAPFLTALTLGIVSAPQDGRPIDPSLGTGPFQLVLQGPDGVSLLRNYDYFGSLSKIEKVQFRVIPDDNLRVLELKNRRVDLLQNNVPPVLLPALKNEEGIAFQSTEGINISYLGVNLRKSPLDMLKVRQAIASALDVQALIDYRLSGLAKSATGILSPLHWAYEPNVEVLSYNPMKSKELLDLAGYPDPDGEGPRPRLTLTYKTSTKKDRIALARLISRYLGEVGIEVKILPYDWGVFFHDVNRGNFEIYSLTWVGVTDPDIFHYVFSSDEEPPHGANRGGYKNSEIDRLTETGRLETDPERRKKVYGDVQKILSHDLPIIPLWYEDNYAVYGNNLKGLRLRPNASFEWATEVWKE